MAIIKAAENKVNKVLFTVEAAAPKYQMRIAINTIPTTVRQLKSLQLLHLNPHFCHLIQL